MLMATPQNPMAHDGSVTVTSVNALVASSYQNECNIATARSNCWLAAGLHDTGKLTVPSFSCGAPFSCAPDGTPGSNTTARIMRREMVCRPMTSPFLRGRWPDAYSLFPRQPRCSERSAKGRMRQGGRRQVDDDRY